MLKLSSSSCAVALALVAAWCLAAAQPSAAQVPCGNLCYDLLVPSHDEYSSAVSSITEYSDNIDYDSANDYSSFDSAHAWEEGEVDRLDAIVADFPDRHATLVDRLNTIHADIEEYKANELDFAAQLLADAEQLRIEVENQLAVGEATLNTVSGTLSAALNRERLGSIYRDDAIDITRSSTSCVTRMLVNRDNVAAARDMGERQYSTATEQFSCVSANYDASVSLETELRATLSATHEELIFDQQEFIETSIMARGLSTALSGMVEEGASLSATASTQALVDTDVDFEVNTISTLRSQVDELEVPDIPDPVPSLAARLSSYRSEASELSLSIRSDLTNTLSNFASIRSSGSLAVNAIDSAIALVLEVSTLRSMCDSALPIADNAAAAVDAGDSIITANAEAISTAALTADTFQAEISIQEVDLSELIALLSDVDETRADVVDQLASIADETDALRAQEMSVEAFLNAKDATLLGYEVTADQRQATADAEADAQVSLHARATTDRDNWCALLDDTSDLAVDVSGLSSLTAEYSSAVNTAGDELQTLLSSIGAAEDVHALVLNQVSANTEAFFAQVSALVSLEERLDQDFDLIRCLPAFCLPSV